MKPLRALLFVLVAGCDVGQVEPGPAAPTDLTAVAASGGIHLTWKDNSTDEMHFMVMRMMHDKGSAGTSTTVATLGANSTEYHDGSVESGMTYMYTVEAMNDGGESESAAVEFAAP